MQDSNQKQPTTQQPITQQPITQQATRQTFKFSLLPTGQVDFEGEVTQENIEAISQLLNQAESFRYTESQKQKQASEVHEEVIGHNQKMDAIQMVFLGIVLTLLTFTSYEVVHAISSVFSSYTSSVSNTQKVNQSENFQPVNNIKSKVKTHAR